jgi:hypothetical protein
LNCITCSFAENVSLQPNGVGRHHQLLLVVKFQGVTYRKIGSKRTQIKG